MLNDGFVGVKSTERIVGFYNWVISDTGIKSYYGSIGGSFGGYVSVC